ncbi:uncharacterized protein BO88DRAFT_338075 [Aspergillus vadensis CBS 113365]|uniref:Uncharacterized protein n=1 Tax=Aspergillus vadensis (strain CBS 113365 / IMI 142717 / IBT 24658) TaxID=1448311 RepID=A0A319CPV6_ASPVC|nr:hypothetical protein BO88DRAFT_338075 [Aspergillus vadensis CBS 113365]PYH70442.1 hypothetical protein BO88DRAFT_338075 [Aspergillus vadensis CBS 113365]
MSHKTMRRPRRRSFSLPYNRTSSYGLHRRRSSEASLRLCPTENVEHVRKAVYNIILERLAQEGVDTGNVVSQLLQHCLPTVLDGGLWERILYTPMRVTDGELLQALHLQTPSETVMPADKYQRMTLYVRSFQMTVSELQCIVEKFQDAGLVYAKNDIWLEAMDVMNPNDFVYLRYVGSTTRGPRQRHHEDLVTRKSGFLSKFLTFLDCTYPTIIDSAALYVFPDWLSFEVPEACQHTELMEQACISLLGFPSLLNQTITAVDDFPLKGDDKYRSLFGALETETISRLSPLHFEAFTGRTQIAAWADKIQDYARCHRVTVSLFRNKYYDFPDTLKEMMITQSMPSLLKGKFVLLLTVGGGISRKCYQNSQGFYTGSSNSASIIKSYINRLWSWELKGRVPTFNIDNLITAGALPFVDLCPWHKAEGPDLLAAASFLQRYVMIVRPLIILTMSARASSTVASGFLHPFGYPSSCRFWSEVGRLRLVHYDGVHSIQLPCFHPGQGRFSIKPEIFTRVLDMTLWVLLVTISTTLDSAETFQDNSREAWCEHIKHQVERILSEQRFYETFDHLKKKLHNERPKRAKMVLDARNRSRIAVATRKDVDRFVYSGFAAGDAMSDRRRQQAYRLWTMNIPELHVHIGRDNSHDWFLWANSVETGRSFFVDAIVRAMSPSFTSDDKGNWPSDHKPICFKRSYSILSDGIQELIEAIVLYRDELISAAEIIEEVTSELSRNLVVWQWVHIARMTELASEDRGPRFKPVYLSQLNATEIFIWKNCTFGIYWVDALGENHKFVMCAPQSSQKHNGTWRKFIFFTKDGIDVRDEAGSSCLSYSGSLGPRNLVTFPVQRLSNCQATASQSRDLIYLWQLETGLDWNMTINQMNGASIKSSRPHDSQSLPNSFFVGKGRELIRANWHGDKLQPYQQPPQPADETWLLLGCLQEHWPAGGTLFIGDPVKWPARADDNIWVHLQECVQFPEPYRRGL